MGSAIYKIEDMLCNEMDKLAERDEFASGSLDFVDKLTHALKSVKTIIAMDEAGYSNDDKMYDNRGGSYDGESYARGRRGNVRRDSMGRYSRDGGSYRGYDRRGYSRDEAKDELMEHLNEMERSAKDEDTRRMVREWKKMAKES